MKPLVSLIVTYYNSDSLGDFVHKSMDYLLNQTYQNIEIICVNDGSTDTTLETLKGYEKKDNRIIIIDKINQKYAQYSKAAGQRAASGDWCFLIDHDDLVAYDAVEKAIEKINDNPSLDIVSMVVKLCNENGETLHYNNLDLVYTENFVFEDRIITGKEYLEKTVGLFDVHIRGLVKSSIFKSVSFDFTEPLLNADEIVERQIFSQAKFIGSCNSFYSYFMFMNSSAKSKSIKHIDIVITDVILRDYFKKNNLYEIRKNIFENIAYRNLVNGIKTYHAFSKVLVNDDKKMQLDRLKLSFKNIDKKEILKNKPTLVFIYQSLVLFNFQTMLLYYKIKS